MTPLSPLEAFDDVVAKIADSTARDFPQIEPEDLSQHLYLTILQNRKQFGSPDAAGVIGALWGIAKRYATQLRAEGLHISVQYAYRPSDIKVILEHTFSQEQWMSTVVPEDAISLKASADELDLQSDIKWAWTQLNLEEQKVVFEKYALKEELDATKRKRLTRAINRLTEIVNTYPRPGHPRRAMSNTKAQHALGAAYE